MQTFPISSLSAGDILLHRGASQISKLISWSGDSPYSHGSLYDGQGYLIEAGGSGVVDTRSVADAVAHKETEYIDAYRYLNPPAPLQAAVDQARSYVGTRYGFQELKVIVIAVALRRKTFRQHLDTRLKYLLRMLIDQLVSDDPTQIICTELVYRGLNEADTTPSHLLRPEISIQDYGFPQPWDIDLVKLAAELLELAGLTANLDQAQEIMSDLYQLPDAESVDAQLEESLNRAQARLGLASESTLLQQPGFNPQTIIPLDFQTSPTLTLMGRLELP